MAARIVPRRLWESIVCIAAMYWLAGSALNAQAPSKPESADLLAEKAVPELHERPRYHIERGDVLDLVFPLEVDFNQDVTVTPDGYVSLRGLSDLYVAGKSLPELHDALIAAYSGILHNPIINVALKDFQKPFFIVNGRVAHPGKFDLREDITVSQALAIAGGVTDAGKSSQILLFRHMPGGTMVEVRKLDMKKMLSKGDLTEDAVLQPGDLIFVPQNVISKIQRFLPTSSLGLYTTGIP